LHQVFSNDTLDNVKAQTLSSTDGLLRLL